MKSAAIAFVSCLMIISVVLILTKMDNRSIRQSELETNVSVALEQTMTNLKVDKKYDVHTEAGINEWVADFIQSLLICTDSNSGITVNILKADPEKGILDVECVSTYKVNNKTKSISCRKTVLFDEWVNPDSIYHAVKFVVDGEVKQTINVHEGDLLESVQSAIAKPEKEGKAFAGWKWEEDGCVYTDFADSGITVEHDIKFEAVFKNE